MRFQLWVLASAGLLASGAAAQTLNNGSLNGKFYFVHLLVTASGGQATNAQNLSGSMTFNGTGGYSYTGKLGSGSGAQAASSASGTYSVAASGSVTISNPIRNTLQISGRLSGDGNVLVGASTEASDNANDIFVAIKAPTGNVTNAVLNGAYTGASLQFPNGLSSGMKSALVTLSPSGSGQFSRVTVVGHAVDQASRNASQDATGSSYSINGDGTGTANFGSTASLFSGTREIFVSQDGNYIIGDSTANGGRDIFVATKNFSTSANAGSFNGRYWITELTMDNPSAASCSGFNFQAASGALQALGTGRAIFSERIHFDTRPLDFSGLNAYSVNSDSTGVLAPFLLSVSNMALGVSVNVGATPRPNTVVGAQIGAVNTTSCQYGIFFGVRAPTFSASGSTPFVDPTGVVNAASFAPFPNPAAPGAITALFGANLAASTVQASSLPLLTTLGGVSVTVNGTPAPLFFVSAGQINFQTPFEASGNSATIQVTNSGVRSNEVIVPLAPTSPAIFQFTEAQDPNRGIVAHADGSLVCSVKDPNTGCGGPARVGETVILYLSGLGALRPAVASGAGNPSGPLAAVADPQVFIRIGGEIATKVLFIGGTPTLVGLYQINVEIPQTVIAGPNVPIEIITSNADSDIVDIPIGI